MEAHPPLLLLFTRTQAVGLMYTQMKLWQPKESFAGLWQSEIQKSTSKNVPL